MPEKTLIELVNFIGEKIELSQSNSAPTQPTQEIPPNKSAYIENQVEDIKLRAVWIQEFFEKGDLDMVKNHIGSLGEDLYNILKVL